MNKTIFLVLLVILILPLSTFAQACLIPYPVWGKYDLFGLKQGEVTVILEAYGQTYTQKIGVNKEGEYSDDFCNFGLPAPPYPGATGRLIACTDHPSCIKEFRLDSSGQLRHDFIFVDITQTTPTSTNTITYIPKEKPQQTQCFDGTLVTAPKTCPEPYTCSNGVKVASKEQCPVESNEYQTIAITALVAAGSTLGFIGLYKHFRRKKQYSRAEKMKDTFIKKRKK